MKGKMTMDASVLAQAIQKAVPSFSPNDEYVQDGLTYYLINDLGSFICRSAISSSTRELDQGLDFLESLLAEEDSEAEKLVGDCIWGLLDCSAYEDIRPLFGSPLRKLSSQYPPK